MLKSPNVPRFNNLGHEPDVDAIVALNCSDSFSSSFCALMPYLSCSFEKTSASNLHRSVLVQLAEHKIHFTESIGDCWCAGLDFKESATKQVRNK